MTWMSKERAAELAEENNLSSGRGMKDCCGYGIDKEVLGSIVDDCFGGGMRRGGCFGMSPAERRLIEAIRDYIDERRIGRHEGGFPGGRTDCGWDRIFDKEGKLPHLIERRFPGEDKIGKPFICTAWQIKPGAEYGAGAGERLGQKMGEKVGGAISNEVPEDFEPR